MIVRPKSLSGHPDARARQWAVALAKIAMSTLLLAATVGLLWHASDAPSLWPNVKPPLFYTLASGWYHPVYMLARFLFVQSAAKGLVYLAVCLGAVCAVYAAPFIRSGTLRVLLSALFLLGIGYDLVMYDIGGDLPNIETTNTILSNIALGLEGTVQAYGAKILTNATLVVLGAFVFCIPPPDWSRAVARGCMVATVAGIAGVLGLYWKTNGYTAIFPSPFSSYLNAYQVLNGSSDEPAREVAYVGPLATTLRKIVLIVDESVRGDFLSLNDPAVDTTPFLLSQTSRIANFGIAVSTANCSEESRVALRYGRQEGDMKAGSRQGTTIWQFAKHAGYQAIYIDTFGSETHLVHGIGKSELALVDRRIVVNDKPQYERDDKVASRLLELLSDPHSMFIYVEKFGSHTPYNANYPANQNIFNAPRNSVFELEDKINLRAQYRNTIRWSVDRFFTRILTSGLPPETLVIYTSDHGQSLSENSTLQTHCSQGARAVSGEANIPLLAFSSDARWRALLSAGSAQNRDRASAFDIFPTLVEAMGYPENWVRAHLGQTLIAPIPPDRIRTFWASGSLRPFDHGPH
jgi:glucan phosphoethanolaminetransferase (alkaline phosphatase superfamily)